MLFQLGGLNLSDGIVMKSDYADENSQSSIINKDFAHFISDSLKRHITGDWGILCDEDRAVNDKAAKNGGRVISAYKYKDGTEIWIITEADRSMTSVILREEYT